MTDHFLGEPKWYSYNNIFSARKLKYIVKITDEKNEIKKPKVLSVTQKGIIVKDIDSGKGQQSLDYSKYPLVKKGNFVMNHMDLLTGYVDISNFEGVTSPDYRIFKLVDENIDPQYLLKICQICYKLKVFYAFGQGVSLFGRWRFVEDNFLNFKIPYPDKKKQKKILEEIDKIEKKFLPLIHSVEKRIELIREYFNSQIDLIFKKAISNISKGKMTKIKYFCKLKSGNSLNSEAKEKYANYSGDYYPYISTENIDYETSTINYKGNFKIPKNEKNFKIAEKNSILLCIEGGSYGKKISITEHDVFFVNKLCNIKTEINSKYLFYFLKSSHFKNEFFSRRIGLISGVRQDEIAEIKVPLINQQEQEKISKLIDIQFKNNNETIVLSKKYLSKIQEYYYKIIFDKLVGNN